MNNQGTIIISMALTTGILGSLIIYSPTLTLGDSVSVERYTPRVEAKEKVVVALDLSHENKKELIDLEHASYHQILEPEPEPVKPDLNVHEARIYQSCIDMDMTLEQTAFVLANTRHETGQYRFMEEIQGRSQARRLGYKGGENWYGRGYIQLTHITNYQLWSNWTGRDLIGNPDLLITDLDLSAYIACSGIKHGSFTARPPVSHYINDHKKDYFNARELVNGDKWSMGNKITEYTNEYITILK